MPQMAPMNWTLLFISFIGLYLICMIVIYFTSTPLLESKASAQYSGGEVNVLWKW